MKKTRSLPLNRMHSTEGRYLTYTSHVIWELQFRETYKRKYIKNLN
jgi:hypothetical protein